MAKERFGSNAQLTGVGTLQIIGNHAYAYSGLVQTAGDNTYSSVLTFPTGAYYLKGTLNLMLASGNNDDLAVKISINGLDLGEWYQQTPPNDFTSPRVEFIIPPNSVVDVEIKNGQSSSARDIYIGFIGRVYDA